MLTVRLALSVSVILLEAALTAGQPANRDPHIAYVYPAGARCGTSITMIVGGQHLNGATAVYLSGDGVRGSVVKVFRPMRSMDRREREEIRRRLREAARNRVAKFTSEGIPLSPYLDRVAKTLLAGRSNAVSDDGGGEFREHPLLVDLDSRSLRELLHVRNQFFEVNRQQRNPQLAQPVVVELTVDDRASPGDRELRLATSRGLTNPMKIQIGQSPEFSELEPNDPDVRSKAIPEVALQLPITINGQVLPGDVDRFAFQAQNGQQLVIEVSARRLIPYLADAVPGWFQATLSLYDKNGREMSFVDDYRFDPDPVMFFEVPETGLYQVEIRDAIYRGRDDFVYRISISERPFVTEAFPIGARLGSRGHATIEGWNLPRERLILDGRPGTQSVRHTAILKENRWSNDISYSDDSLPDEHEREPNDSVDSPQRMPMPRVVNGRIERSGDLDYYQIQGHRNDWFVAEVLARRLGSPLDSLLRLLDEGGRVIAFNDDCVDKQAGLCTHHADSYLRLRLPETGVFYLQVSDAQGHGGTEYSYRLRMGAPRPDFAVRVTPSSINLKNGRDAVLAVHVIRMDGFDGEIEVRLKDAPSGYVLSGARVPSGQDQVRMTLRVSGHVAIPPGSVELEACTYINGRRVSRQVIPADDLMQAFLYRHLVPAQALMVCVKGKRPASPINIINDLPLAVPLDGFACVRLETAGRDLENIMFELDDPPPGISLDGATRVEGEAVLRIRADSNVAQLGLRDNLIVNAFVEREREGRKIVVPVGVLPAVPFQIVSR